MPCTSRYAEGWQYLAYNCTGAYRTGVDGGGGVGLAYLTDAGANFVDFGVRPGVGMILWNLTANTSGLITAVTATTIVATGVTWTNGNAYRVVAMTGDERSQAELYLDITAADIHAALAAQGACNCSMDAWATNLLGKINIIEASIFHDCPCASPQLNDSQRQLYLTWVNTQLDNIRTGKLELCSGQTGSDFPSISWAEQSSTPYAADAILNNAILRTP